MSAKPLQRVNAQLGKQRDVAAPLHEREPCGRSKGGSDPEPAVALRDVQHRQRNASIEHLLMKQVWAGMLDDCSLQRGQSLQMRSRCRHHLPAVAQRTFLPGAHKLWDR